MEKRGQVTIFVLVAIVIVAAILVFFLWTKPSYFSKNNKGTGFEKCVKDVIGQSVGELEKKAGFFNPEFTYAYNGEKFTYLCYTNNYYETCSVQVPFLKNNFEKQMDVFIKDRVDMCYTNSLDELKSQGYSVVGGDVEYNISITPGSVGAKISAPTVVGSQSIVRFNIKVNSPVYEIVMIATSILQSEARYGDSDVSKMMLLYPNYIIDKIKRSDGTTVYILENKISRDKFQFASRSLAWPAGYLI